MAFKVASIRRLGSDKKFRDAGEGLILFRVKHMQDRADQQRMAGLLPVIALLQGSFGVDEHVRNVLDIAHLPFPAPDLQKWIIGGRPPVGRIKQQHPAMHRAETRGQIPVFALYVVYDATARPGQKGRNDETDALARTGRCKTKHMLRSIMTQVMAPESAEHDAVRSHKLRGQDFRRRSPTRRAVSRGRLASRARQIDIAKATSIERMPPDAAMHAP